VEAFGCNAILMAADIQSRARNEVVKGWLKKLKGEGLSFIFVEHNDVFCEESELSKIHTLVYDL